jgi:endonuclease/exonuclease/phosphatase family metal-dependent hydrolase
MVAPFGWYPFFSLNFTTFSPACQGGQGDFGVKILANRRALCYNELPQGAKHLTGENFMRIMTSNIWGDYFGNPTVGRDEKLYGVYQKYTPDVIGFQEVTRGWYASNLFQKLSSDYDFVGTELFGSKNFVPLAIKKELSLLEKGFAYLKDTPDSSKAITWAVLKQNGVVFAVCNTHFWWMRGTESEKARERLGVLDFSPADHCDLRAKNATQLAELMKHLQGKYACPVFAFGDMNATVTESIFDVFARNGIKNLFDQALQRDTTCTLHGDPEKDADGVFRGTKATEAYLSSLRKELCLPEAEACDPHLSSIDHLVALGDSFQVPTYRVIEDQDALDATDHSPVFVDVSFLA